MTDHTAALRDLIADDAYAATFQSMGQYRSALLRAAQLQQPASADIQCLLSFIFKRFGAPGDAGELPDDVVAAVRRLEGVQPQQAAGWKLVPVEPSTQMLSAVCHGHKYLSYGDCRRIYAAMLAAAPAHPSQQEDDVLDAARLDWIVAQECYIQEYPDRGYRLIGASLAEWQCDWHPTARAAIDAAMSDSAGEGRKNG